jgi:DNA invertase Pin-like site-specific DNA recombinase
MEYTGKRAWLYMRIDAPEDSHGALKGQEKELYDYSEHVGLSIAGSSSDLDSGSDDSNKQGLEQVIAAALDGRFDILLVKSSDRLYRDAGRIVGIIRQLNEIGVTVCSPIEGESKPDLPTLMKMEALP